MQTIALARGLAIAVAAVAAAWMGVANSRVQPGHATGSSAGVGAQEPTSPRTDQQPKGALGKQVAEKAVSQWVSAGVDKTAAAALGQDVEVVISAFLESDFRAYDAIWRERGATLNEPVVTAIAKQLRQGPYASDSSAVWNDGSAAQKLEYIRSHPGPRNAGWSKIDVGGVAAGIGWHFKPVPGKTGPVWTTIYKHPDDPAFFNRSQTDTTRNAWVQVPLVTSNDAQIEVRLNFAFDETRKQWYPMRIDARGTSDIYLLF